LRKENVMDTSKEWNNKYSVNQSVYLKEYDGSITSTQTRSIAWDLDSEEPVIMVTGRTGGYSLKRIEAR